MITCKIMKEQSLGDIIWLSTYHRFLCEKELRNTCDVRAGDVFCKTFESHCSSLNSMMWASRFVWFFQFVGTVCAVLCIFPTLCRRRRLLVTHCAGANAACCLLVVVLYSQLGQSTWSDLEEKDRLGVLVDDDPAGRYSYLGPAYYIALICCIIAVMQAVAAAAWDPAQDAASETPTDKAKHDLGEAGLELAKLQKEHDATEKSRPLHPASLTPQAPPYYNPATQGFAALAMPFQQPVGGLYTQQPITGLYPQQQPGYTEGAYLAPQVLQVVPGGPYDRNY